MKKFSGIVAASVACILWFFPGTAMSETPTATFDADLSVKPGSTLYKAPYSPGVWRVRAALTPPEAALSMLPMKVARIQLPSSGALTFNPSSSAPACPDSKLSSKTDVNRPFEALRALCPSSLIGNGLGDFYLGQQKNNQQTGGVYIFNGGLVKGQSKIKIVAYSTRTEAGIYTEGILSPDGKMTFNLPRLTADSSITTLDLRIPGEEFTFESNSPTGAPVQTTLAAGLDPNFVRVGCPSGSWAYGADFVLGKRDSAGRPTTPDTPVSAPDTSDNCSGAAGKAKLSKPVVTGPKAIRRGKTATYKVKLTNTGTATVTNVRLSIAGKGVRVNSGLRNVAVRSSQTETIKIKAKSKGKIKGTFKVTSSGGTHTVRKTITVR